MKTKLITLVMVFWSLGSHTQNMVLDFDGADDQLKIESPVDGSSNFTLEFRFKAENGSNNRILNLVSWGHLSSDFPHRFHFVISNNKLAFIDDAQDNGLGYRFPFPNTVIDDTGEWHHIAIVKNSNSVLIHLDDEVYTHTTGRFRPMQLPKDLVFGQRDGEITPGFNGKIDEVRIWDSALSLITELNPIRDCLLDGTEDGLILYYNFDGGLTQNIDGTTTIPDLAGGDDNGTASNFAFRGATSNLVDADHGIDTYCDGSSSCAISFDHMREPCSSTYTFIPSIDDALSYSWNVTRTETGLDETFSDPQLTYPFDFRSASESGAVYEVCLMIVTQDECEAEYCTTISGQQHLFEDASYYQIISIPEDTIVDANPETCTAMVGLEPLIYDVCPSSEHGVNYTRSDGSALDDPFDIGSTTITIQFGEPLDQPNGGLLIRETYSYEVEVLPVDGCCESQNFVNIGTGIDENGDKVQPGLGVVDIKWRLLNNPPYENGCTDPFQNSINGSAYLMNHGSNDVGWVNQAGVTVLAPIDKGTNTPNFDCNNLVNSQGNRVPFVFERAFCVENSDTYNIDFTYEGDDRVFFELWDITSNTLISTSPTYVWPSGPEEWDFDMVLDPATYAIRAKLVNTNSTTLGFSVKGLVAPYNSDENLLDKGSCCISNSINVLNVLDGDCTGDVSSGDIPGQDWSYELYDSEGVLVQTAMTDINGEFFFSGLEAGIYTIVQETQSGYTPNSPASGSLEVEITDDSFNSFTFYNCPSDCFTVQNTEITCIDHRTYEVSIQIINNNDQVFDRLLMFSQSNQTAVNPTISIDFGAGNGTLDPGDISGEMNFTIQQREFVDEEIEVCFDVIPQNPAGGDCCKDDFCIILPVCCVPDESKDLELVQDPNDECCYNIEISNQCAEDYFHSIEVYPSVDGINIGSASGQNGWNTFDRGDGSISFYYAEGVNPITDDYVPLYQDVVVVGNFCINGVTEESQEEQGISVGWIIGDGDVTEEICTESIETECTPDPCNLIFNPIIECDEVTNQYSLSFTLQLSDTETDIAKQLVINPLGNTTVDQYDPQTIDGLNMEPGDSQSFSFDLLNVAEGDLFEFSVTLHDFDNELEDGTYWCCYTGQEVSLTIPPCEPGTTTDESDEIKIADFVVHPNPVKESFVITFDDPLTEDVGIELISNQGELIQSDMISEGSESYRLSMRETLPAIYFIRLKDADGSLRYHKILKL